MQHVSFVEKIVYREKYTLKMDRQNSTDIKINCKDNDLSFVANAHLVSYIQYLIKEE